jgi:hypothetical protein
MGTDSRNLIQVDKWTAHALVWDNLPFWLVPSNCEPMRAIGSTQLRTDLPGHFVKIDSKAENEKTAATLAELLQSRAFNVAWPTRYDPADEDRGKWGTVVSSTLARTRIEFENQHCNNQLGYRSHYYYEHPAEVDYGIISMAIDRCQERAGFHDRPEGTLRVLRYNALVAPGLCGIELVKLFALLPHWTVNAPRSLMVKASRQQNYTMLNTGWGKKRIMQLAFREIDIKYIFDFARVPFYVYTRSVAARYTPRGYTREAIRESASNNQG